MFLGTPCVSAGFWGAPRDAAGCGVGRFRVLPRVFGASLMIPNRFGALPAVLGHPQ